MSVFEGSIKFNDVNEDEVNRIRERKEGGGYFYLTGANQTFILVSRLRM